MRKVIRIVEDNDIKNSYGDPLRIEIDDIAKTVQVSIDEEELFSATREQFLDLVVACWPENVAYQFDDEE